MPAIEVLEIRMAKTGVETTMETQVAEEVTLFMQLRAEIVLESVNFTEAE